MSENKTLRSRRSHLSCEAYQHVIKSKDIWQSHKILYNHFMFVSKALYVFVPGTDATVFLFLESPKHTKGNLSH